MLNKIHLDAGGQYVLLHPDLPTATSFFDKIFRGTTVTFLYFVVFILEFDVKHRVIGSNLQVSWLYIFHHSCICSATIWEQLWMPIQSNSGVSISFFWLLGSKKLENQRKWRKKRQRHKVKHCGYNHAMHGWNCRLWRSVHQCYGRASNLTVHIKSSWCPPWNWVAFLHQLMIDHPSDDNDSNAVNLANCGAILIWIVWQLPWSEVVTCSWQ